MKGIESLLASMMGVDANKMQEMMSGFIDNAAYLAKGIDEIKGELISINKKIDELQQEKNMTILRNATIINSEGVSNVKSDD